MTRTTRLGIAAFLTVAAILAIGVGTFPRAALASAQPATAPSADRIAALVKQLGDSDWQKREAAVKELVAIGAPAQAAVEAAAKSADPEIQKRAESILDQIILVDNPDYDGWKRFKVGSMVKVRTFVPDTGNGRVGDSKVTVNTLKELTPERATLTVQPEGAAAAETLTIPKATSRPAGKVTRREQGEEEVAVAGKKLTCRVSETTESRPDGVTVVVRASTCDQVPGGVAAGVRRITRSVPRQGQAGVIMVKESTEVRTEVLEFRAAD